MAPLICNLGTRWRHEWSLSCPGHFTTGERAHSTCWI